MKKIKTTENKLREAGWSNKIKEPGYFTKIINGTKAVLSMEEYKRADPDEICSYNLFWFDVPTPYTLYFIEEELKKLEE